MKTKNKDFLSYNWNFKICDKKLSELKSKQHYEVLFKISKGKLLGGDTKNCFHGLYIQNQTTPLRGYSSVKIPIEKITTVQNIDKCCAVWKHFILSKFW